jgi:hypothetical protein
VNPDIAIRAVILLPLDTVQAITSVAEVSAARRNRRDLAAEIHAHLANGGDGTAEGIARGIRARTATVRAELRTNPAFSEVPAPPNAHPNARWWGIPHPQPSSANRSRPIAADGMPQLDPRDGDR